MATETLKPSLKRKKPIEMLDEINEQLFGSCSSMLNNDLKEIKGSRRNLNMTVVNSARTCREINQEHMQEALLVS